MPEAGRAPGCSLAVGEDGPASFRLDRPTPNPSAGAARLSFSLPQAGSVQLDVYDLSGRRVWSAEGMLSSGSHAWSWDGRTLEGQDSGAGLFFVRLVTPWGTRGERLVRLR
jgi:hypothetical protein